MSLSQIKTLQDLVFLPFEFYLFSYGANGCRNLAKRLFGDPNVEDHPEMEAYILKRSCFGNVNGFERIFFGYSEYWEGGVAALRANPKCNIKGLFIPIKHDGQKNFSIGDRPINFDQLARVESLHRGMYRLQQLPDGAWSLKSDRDIPAYAFFGCPLSEPVHHPPSPKYLDAIGRMMADHQPSQDLSIKIIVEPQKVAKTTYIYHTSADKGHFVSSENDL